MFTLCVKDHFAAAHRLEAYHGKCEELHGHNFLVEVLIEGERLGAEGMLIDFKVMKGYLKHVLEDLDHKYINEIPFFREKASSSEWLAVYIHGRIQKLMKEKSVVLTEVRVWESENSYAAFRS